MTSGSKGNGPARQPSLEMLGLSVRDARAVVRERRHGPVVPTDLADARRALITALAEYTVALEERHLPVPHALRTELELHRELFDW